MCDKDRDGLLSDAELNDFQVKCFGIPMPKEDLEGIKRVVKENCPEGVCTVDSDSSETNEDGLNILGFLFLHHLFIQKVNPIQCFYRPQKKGIE